MVFMSSKAKLILFVGNPCLLFFLQLLRKYQQGASVLQEKDQRHAEDFEMCTSVWIIPLHNAKAEHILFSSQAFRAMKSCKIYQCLNLLHLKSKKHVKVNQQGYRICTCISPLHSSFNSSRMTFFLPEPESPLNPPTRIS